MSETSESGAAASGTALFALGFRPFFLLAMLSAALLIAPWTLVHRGALAFHTYYGALPWHAHEMMFGYTTAVVAGFLLTAVSRWTDRETARGGLLAALALLWLAGRAAPYLQGLLPNPVIAALDLSFLPALAAVLAIPLVRSGAGRNLIFVPVLLLLFAANGLSHAGPLSGALATSRTGLYLGVDIVLLMIAIIGGRVIPFFTERALAGAAPRRWTWLEAIAIGSVVAFALARAVSAPAPVVGGVAAVAACAHALRLAGWHARGVWSVPLLWVLFLGYAWMVIGFALTASTALGPTPSFLALHAFTTGAIGVMTLGMMARVSLGHTGRPLKPAGATVAAFALINLSAALRVLAPLAFPIRTADLIALSALLWVAAFALALTAYAGILVRPRADGLPG
ncbi:MAG TPA: NnrS family protein [Myxococcota bacterium]